MNGAPPVEYGSGGSSNNSTPRGSLSNISSIRGRSASINSSNLSRHQSPALKQTAIMNSSRFSSSNGNNDGAFGNGVGLSNSKRPTPQSPLVGRRELVINGIAENGVDGVRNDKHRMVIYMFQKYIMLF